METGRKEAEQASNLFQPVQSTNNDIKIETSMQLTFQIQGEDGDGKVLREIKVNLYNLIDDIGEEMAKKLTDVFTNLLLKCSI